MSTGINLGFKCTSDRGAFLALSPPAVSKHIQSKKHIIDYIRANFDEWVEFANTTLGLGLKDDEILFVWGTTKTNQWAVTAFRGEQHQAEGSFAVNLGSLGEASVMVSTSTETLPSRYYRTGPSRHAVPRAEALRLPGSDGGGASPSLAREKQDQTIFVNYYKMKKRRLWMGLSLRAAGARSHDDESDPEDDPHPGSHSCVVDESGFDALCGGQGKRVRVFIARYANVQVHVD